MRRRKTAFVAVALSAFLAVGACGEAQNAEVRAAIAEGCALDSECTSPLVCAFRTCHVQCETSRDCEKIGSRLCVQSDKPYRVCQNPSESSCKLNSECPESQICGPDARCRDACLVDRDCGTDQVCTAKVCAERTELIGGTLPGASPPAEGDTCVRPSDCGGDLVCLFGVCTVECVTAKDCDVGLACLESRCRKAGAGGAAGAAGQSGSGGAAGRAGGAGQAGNAGAAGQAGGNGGAAGNGGSGGVACTAGAPCDTGNACELGKTDCSKGAPTCEPAGPRAKGTECRPAAGICDSAEACDGTSVVCPPDARVSTGTECRAASGPCDIAEVCDGTQANCPSDARRPSDFACRAAAGDCDAPELCDGTSGACPDDARLTNGTVCRAATGACDAAEICDGAGVTCPDDALAQAGVECRAAASSCDLAETCSGSSSSCPIDSFATIGETCVGGFCNGLGACLDTCTPNAPCSTGNPCELGKTDCASGVPKCVASGPGNAGALCRPAAGPCDVDDTCTGASTSCDDQRASKGTICRPSEGVCDVAEMCDGNAVVCPDDTLEPATTVCRASAGVCDVAETCTGTTAACPADDFALPTNVCRASGGFCDIAESCTGTSATCPADAFQPASLPCRASGGACDVAESCTGTTAACPSDVFLGPATTCRASTGFCDPAETCSGAQAACPTNAFQPVGTTCATGQCDAAGICAIEQDCTHRWRVATNINSNLTLNASDKTAVIAGFSPTGIHADGHADPAGAPLWTRPLTGSFGGRGSSRYVVYENTSGGARTMGVHDMYDGTPITSYTYYSNVNFGLSLGTSIVSQDGKTSLLSAFAYGSPWSTNANGTPLSGTGSPSMLLLHDAAGAYVTHVAYSTTTQLFAPSALFDGRWAIPITPSGPVTFGTHTVGVGTNEIVVLTSSLGFERAHTLSFPPQVMTIVPGNNLRVASDGSLKLAAYADAGLVWSRNDCGGTTLGATPTQIIVTTAANGTFCGRPTPFGLGLGMGVAVLDAATGATLSVRWFPTSTTPQATAIAIDGDTYFVYPDNATVCGVTSVSPSVVAY